MKKYKSLIIAAVIIAAALTVAFFCGEKPPENRDVNTAVSQGETPRGSSSVKSEENDGDSADADRPESNPNEEIKMPGEEATEENKPSSKSGGHLSAEEKMALAERMSGNTDPSVSAEPPEVQSGSNTAPPAEPGNDEDNQNAPSPNDSESEVKELTCTMSISCANILKNIAWLNKDKLELIPKDGIIFAETTVAFYKGESVFNLLVREMKKNKIHLEFVNTPVYNSAYIEGINNIYEFDCGELSGWMYRVNGVCPNYGCSRYILKQGDKVEWLYTCDLGSDVGADSSGGGQRDE